MVVLDILEMFQRIFFRFFLQANHFGFSAQIEARNLELIPELLGCAAGWAVLVRLVFFQSVEHVGIGEGEE